MRMALGENSRLSEGVQSANRATQLDTEAKWIRTAQHGDVCAFNELVLVHQTRAYRLAYRILSDVQMASDATQEAFISAFRHLGALRGDSFAPWLMRIVTNACYDQLRMKQKQRSSSLEAFAAAPESIDTQLVHGAAVESPQDFVERRELNELIQQGLAKLPFDQRVAVVLADAQNYNYKQIAEMTGANVGTVKSRLARGRNSLREFLLAEQELLPGRYRQTFVSAERKVRRNPPG